MHHDDSNNIGTIGTGSIPRSAKRHIFDGYDVHETIFNVNRGTNWSEMLWGVNNELQFEDMVRVNVGRRPSW